MTEKDKQPGIAIDGNVTDGNIILGNKNIVSNVSGSTNVVIGNKGTVNQISSPDDIATAFATIYKIISELPQGSNKVVAKQAVKELESEARKGESPDRSKVEKWLAFLADTAEDAWNVAVDTLSNPIKGISTVYRMIIAKAKEEREKSKK